MFTVSLHVQLYMAISSFVRINALLKVEILIEVCKEKDILISRILFDRYDIFYKTVFHLRSPYMC